MINNSAKASCDIYKNMETNYTCGLYRRDLANERREQSPIPTLPGRCIRLQSEGNHSLIKWESENL